MAVSISSVSLSLPPIGRRTSLPSVSFSSSINSSLVFSRGGIVGRTRNSRSRSRSRGLSCNCMFGLGVPELVVIAGVAALVFGPKKLPEVGRSIGKTVKSFQQAAKEFETELKKEPDAAAIEQPTSEKPPGAATEEEKKEVTVSSTKEDSL